MSGSQSVSGTFYLYPSSHSDQKFAFHLAVEAIMYSHVFSLTPHILFERCRVGLLSTFVYCRVITPRIGGLLREGESRHQGETSGGGKGERKIHRQGVDRGALGLGAELLVVPSECLGLVCFTGLWVLGWNPGLLAHRAHSLPAELYISGLSRGEIGSGLCLK